MKVFAAFLLIICLSTLELGCFFGKNDFIEPVNYDLVLPEGKFTVSVPVEVDTFRNISGSDRRMSLRCSGKRVAADEYNRWLLPPEVMLQRIFVSALPAGAAADAGSGTVKIECVLYRFDFDVEKKEAAAAADFTLRFRDAVIRRNIAKKVLCKDNTPEARAAAMNQAVAEMVAEVSGAVSALPVSGGSTDAGNGGDAKTKENK